MPLRRSTRGPLGEDRSGYDVESPSGSLRSWKCSYRPFTEITVLLTRSGSVDLPSRTIVRITIFPDALRMTCPRRTGTCRQTCRVRATRTAETAWRSVQGRARVRRRPPMSSTGLCRNPPHVRRTSPDRAIAARPIPPDRAATTGSRCPCATARRSRVDRNRNGNTRDLASVWFRHRKIGFPSRFGRFSKY